MLGFNGLTNDWTTGWSISVLTSETGITNIVNAPADAAVSCRQNAVRIETQLVQDTSPSLNTSTSWAYTHSVTWTNAFSSAVAVVTGLGSSDSMVMINGIGPISLSTTGASQYCNVYNTGSQRTTTVSVYFLGVGT